MVEHAAEAGKPAQATRRAQLRLLAELLACGVSSSHGALLQAVSALPAGPDSDGSWAGLTLLAGFSKAGREDLLGLPPRHTEDLEASASALQVGPRLLALLTHLASCTHDQPGKWCPRCARVPDLHASLEQQVVQGPTIRLTPTRACRTTPICKRCTSSTLASGPGMPRRPRPPGACLQRRRASCVAWWRPALRRPAGSCWPRTRGWGPPSRRTPAP